MFRKQFLNHEKSVDFVDSHYLPVVVLPHQHKSGDDLARMLSQGLAPNCAIRRFNTVDPHADRLETIDAIAAYRERHGLDFYFKEIQVSQPVIPDGDTPPPPSDK